MTFTEIETLLVETIYSQERMKLKCDSPASHNGQGQFFDFLGVFPVACSAARDGCEGSWYKIVGLNMRGNVPQLLCAACRGSDQGQDLA